MGPETLHSNELPDDADGVILGSHTERQKFRTSLSPPPLPPALSWKVKNIFNHTRDVNIPGWYPKTSPFTHK